MSVLFLDLVGFTRIAEGRDAEETRELLSSYFENAKSVIERHGGVVEKFIGDAVMAAWGTPTAHEDDAERAVRTALELLDVVAAVGEDHGLSMQARAGVVTGEAATRPGAVSQGMVAGDMVNTASRLQAAADPGTVLVGEATVRASRGAIAFEPVGELELKGKEEPYRAFRALRVVADLDVDPDLLEPPFVGRNEELRLLKEQLHGIGRDRKARVVSVTGIGGIGKSRLAREFGRYVDGLTELYYWHTGRCPAYGEGITFWALGEMVRRRAEIAEGEDPEQARRKLTAAVGEYVTDPSEHAWVEPRLAFLLGLEERPSGSGEELFAAWRLFFERLSDTGPVVMVFEDLQWADQGLLDYIDAMLHWSRDHPILVIALSRPEISDSRPNWGVGQRFFTSLYLDPLKDEQMKTLVRGLVPDAPEEATAKIVERSEGVPLYAVEMIRMLADRGILEARDHDYQLVGSVDDLEVPETLQSLIAARLDGLSPEDRSIVQNAAVLGKSFSGEALATMASVDLASLETHVGNLVKQEILTVDADPRSPERGQYVFAQSLIREVAYGTLSKSDRRERHVKAAELIESLGDEELAAAVASHWLEAWRASPSGPEANQLAVRARDWLVRASDRAVQLGSPGQALALVKQAIELTDESLERRELLLLASRASTDAVLLAEAEQYLRDAASLASEAGDNAAEAMILGDLLQVLHISDRQEETRRVAGDIVDRFGDSQDPRIRPNVSRALNFVRFLDGDHSGALLTVDSAVAGYEAIGDVERFLRDISPKIFLLLLNGRGVEATMLARGYVEWIREHGDLRQLASALSTAGTTLTNEDPRGSFALVQEGIEVARKGGFGNLEVGMLTNGAESAIELGEFEIAEEMLTRLKGIPALPTTELDAFQLNVANLAAYRGESERAHEAMAQIQREDLARSLSWIPRVRSVVLTQGGDPDTGYDLALASMRHEGGGPNVPFALWSAARAALWSEQQIPDAADRLKTLIEETANLGGAWLANARASLSAAVTALNGHRDDAMEQFGDVLGVWKSMELPFDHAATVGDAVVVLGPDSLPEREIQSAIDYLTGIGAVPMLERITGRT